MIHVYGVFLPKTILTEYASAVDVFRIANQFGGDFVWHSVAPESVHALTDAAQVIVPKCELLPESLPDGAVVVIPGSLAIPLEMNDPAFLSVMDWLKHVIHEDVTVCAICSGAFVVAGAGLLNGFDATTHHSLCDRLAQFYPSIRVRPQRAVVRSSGRKTHVWTCAGLSSGIDMLLHALGELAGTTVMQNTMREMVVYFQRSLEDEQMSPWLRTRHHAHAGVHRVQDMLQKEFDQPHDLNSLANTACMSPRNLTRLFKQNTGMSVVQYQQWVRVSVLKKFLSSGAYSVEKASLAAGFGSARHARYVWGKFEKGSIAAFRAG